MATKFCSKCGAKLRENAKFCGSCGNKIQHEQSEESRESVQSVIITHKAKSLTEIYAKEEAKIRGGTTQVTGYAEEVTFREKFFSTDGRLNRMTYFKRWLAVDIMGFILSAVLIIICSALFGDTNSIADPLSNVIWIGLLIPKFCLDVRRVKDIGKDENFAKRIAGLEAVLLLAQIYLLFDWDFSTSMPPGAVIVNLLAWGIFCWMQGTAGKRSLNSP